MQNPSAGAGEGGPERGCQPTAPRTTGRADFGSPFHTGSRLHFVFERRDPLLTQRAERERETETETLGSLEPTLQVLLPSGGVCSWPGPAARTAQRELGGGSPGSRGASISSCSPVPHRAGAWHCSPGPLRPWASRCKRRCKQQSAPGVVRPRWSVVAARPRGRRGAQRPRACSAPAVGGQGGGPGEGLAGGGPGLQGPGGSRPQTPLGQVSLGGARTGIAHHDPHFPHFPWSRVSSQVLGELTVLS